jgi:TrmH family RNA methyltransferase
MPSCGPPPAASITSTGNPRIVDARKLDQRKHRQRQGRFLVEGLQLLHMALDAGAAPVEAFYCREQWTGAQAGLLLDRLAGAGAATHAVSAAVMASLAERETPQGLVATFRMLDRQMAEVRLAGSDLVVVVDRLQDPGNLGTLVRTADAVGAAAVALIEPCVDLYDPKTVRGSMGSLFTVPVVRAHDPAELAAWLRGAGLRLVGADPRLGRDYGEGGWLGGVALVLGNEARGLSDDVRGLIADWVRLPIVGRAESLNVAVAGGVLMYMWLRENRPGSGALIVSK